MIIEEKEISDNNIKTEDKNKIDNKVLKVNKKHKKSPINKNNNKDKNSNKIQNEQIIDTFYIEKNFDFSNYNINYTWKDNNFIRELQKKRIRKSNFFGM